MRTVCGLDVHKDSVFVCIMNGNGEKFEARYGVLTPELEALRQLLLGHAPVQPAHLRPEQGEGVQTRQTGCLAPTMQHPDQQLPLLYRQQELQGGGEAVVRGRDQPRETDGSPARAHGEPGGQGDLEIRPDRRGHGDGHRPDRAVPPEGRTP